MFSLPQASRGDVEGTDDSNPIYLHGISKVNFQSFLHVLYPLWVSSFCRKIKTTRSWWPWSSKGAPTTSGVWFAALELAIMWRFKEVRLGLPENIIILVDPFSHVYIFVFGAQIRKTCIEALSELIKSRTVIDKILLAKKYKVKKWLRDGYIQLLQSRELEFGNDICTSEIDVITIGRLLYIRERRHCELKRDALYCLRCSNDFFINPKLANSIIDEFFSTDVANRKIDEVFADEIAGMQDDDD